MAKYDLDLRMGVDDKLVVANKEIGALSYSVDKQNLYIDALKEDKATIERQMVNADKAYAIRDFNEDIITQCGYGEHSFQVGYSPENILKIKISRKEGYADATFDYEIVEGILNLDKTYVLKYKAVEQNGEISYHKVEFINDSLKISNFSMQYSLNPNTIYEVFDCTDKILGDYFFSIGSENQMESSHGVVIGHNSWIRNNPNYCYLIGQHNYTIFDKNYILGNECYSYGPSSFSIGEGILSFKNDFNLGRYNKIDAKIDYELIKTERISSPFGDFYFNDNIDIHTDTFDSSKKYTPAGYYFSLGDDVKHISSIEANRMDLETFYDTFKGKYIQREFLDQQIQKLVFKPIYSYYTSGDNNRYEVLTQIEISYYGIKDISNNLIFSIGNGVDNNNRSNAFTIDLDGNVSILKNLNLNGNAYFKGNFNLEGSIFDKNGIEVINLNSSSIELKKDAQIFGSLNITDILYANQAYFSGNVQVYSLQATNNITIKGDNVITQTSLDSAKDEIMDEVNLIASSITTQIWQSGEKPPTDSKLLWIKTGTDYGNGVMYYFDSTKYNEDTSTTVEYISYKNSMKIEYSDSFSTNGGMFILNNPIEYTITVDNLESEALQVLNGKYIKVDNYLLRVTDLDFYTGLMPDPKPVFGIMGYKTSFDTTNEENWIPMSAIYS